ncbi:MAG TPA: helix-turn-helix transcriptional regulator [Ktedonobacterales bacterium]|nr:helix-turn-helix transcriptional regulator [Ktedonobacterales bacterium]
MISPSQHTTLAALLVQLGLSQANLAERSRTHPRTIARAVRGEQVSAAVRARIVAAINVARAETGLPGELSASDIFPTG